MEDGEKVAKDLMGKLGVTEDCLIEGAYMDHVLNQQKLIQVP